MAIEKRAMSFPALAFSPAQNSSITGLFAGEVIDLLEPYALSRSADGKPLWANEP